jgi:hypothetical protein
LNPDVFVRTFTQNPAVADTIQGKNYPPLADVAQYDEGSTVTIEVVSAPDTSQKTIVVVKSASTGSTVFSKELSGATGTVDVTGLSPGVYYVEVSNGGFTLATASGTFSTGLGVPTATGGYRITRVSPSQFTGANPIVIEVRAATPKIDISIKNPRTPVAIGDIAVFKFKISGVSGRGFQVEFALDGPYNGNANGAFVIIDSL